MEWIQSRLHSFSEKPVIEHSQTSRGKRVGDFVSKLSSKEPLLQEEGDGGLVRYQAWWCFGSQSGWHSSRDETKSITLPSPSWSKMDRMSDKILVLVVKSQTVGPSRVLQSHKSKSPCHKPCYGCIWWENPPWALALTSPRLLGKPQQRLKPFIYIGLNVPTL